MKTPGCPLRTPHSALRTRRRGLTLIELLVALTIGVMLLLITAQIFRTGLLGRERLAERSLATTALRRAFETISRDMHSAVVPPDDSGLRFGLDASPAGSASHVLQFASAVGEPLLAGRAANETVLVQYAIAPDPRTDQPALCRYEVPYPVPDGASPGTSGDTRAMVLLPGASGITYLFYDLSQQSWVESWDAETGLPAAIRLDIAMQSGHREDTSRLESWIFSLPAARYANDEAAEAAGGNTPQP